MITYDYIIIGAGASGLMLADAMGNDVYFKDRSILLLDKETKKDNDRTWCYWEQGSGPFDTLIFKKWSQFYFGGQHYSANFEIKPYTYKMVRGIDFYDHYLGRIAGHGNIDFVQEQVLHIDERKDEAAVTTGKQKYYAKQVFNSIVDYTALGSQRRYPVLQQHFLGWFIKTEKAVFDVDQATFMDFSMPTKGDTRFMYVLPFSPTEALVECTLFSETLLGDSGYETTITDYLNARFDTGEIRIQEKEKGRIPMTCYNFAMYNTDKVLGIGVAGGWAKPSTGYTFYGTYRKTDELVNHLKQGKPLSAFAKKKRFWYYDLLLLDILKRKNHKGGYIFESMFQKRRPQLILKFLDEQTNLWEDLLIISGCPKKEFISAFFRRLLRIR